MRIITTNSVWAQFILAILLMGLGLGFLTLSPGLAMKVVGDIWFILGIVVLL